MIPNLVDPCALLVCLPLFAGFCELRRWKGLSFVANRAVWSGRQPSPPSSWAPHAPVTRGALTAQDNDITLFSQDAGLWHF